MVKDTAKNNVVNPSFVRDHLANERTYLAWTRTVFAVMALGFVVAMFQLIVSELTGTTVPLASSYPLSIIGIVLVLVGGLLNVFAFIRFRNNQQRINTGTFGVNSTAESIFSVAIVVITILLIAYLLATLQ